MSKVIDIGDFSVLSDEISHMQIDAYSDTILTVSMKNGEKFTIRHWPSNPSTDVYTIRREWKNSFND